MRLARGHELLGAAAVALFAAHAAATERATPKLSVQAPSAALCPSEAELGAAVERRLLPSSVVDPTQRFDVTIEANPRGMSARLVVHDARGSSAERVIEAENCADAFDSLAFIVAMTIDPKTAEQPAGAPVEPVPGATSDAEPTPVPPPLTPSPEPPPVAAAPAVATGQKDQATERRPALTRSPSYELGLLVEGNTAIAPGVTPGGRLFGGIRLPSVGVVYPSFRLSVARSTEREAPVDDERGGHLTVTAGRLEACAASGLASRRFLLDLCPAADLGVRDGEGYGVDPPKTPARAWFALDLLGRLGFLAGDWALIQAEGGLVIPVTRDTFVVNGPSAEVFETPALAYTFGGGMAVRLP